MISEEDHVRLKNELHAEKEQHARTQLQLSLTEEKLQLFESEAQILAKQLEREKNTFQNALAASLRTIIISIAIYYIM